MNYPEQFLDKMLSHDVIGSLKVIDAALKEGLAPEQIMTSIVTHSMDVVGQMQTNQEIPLSKVFLLTNIGELAIDRVQKLHPIKNKPIGTIVLGSAEGDCHSLGRKMVAASLKIAGFKVIDLGASVPAKRLVNTAISEKADIIGVSALLLHPAQNIRKIRDLLDSRKSEHKIKLIVGGAIFNIDRELYKIVGADSMTVNALDAAQNIRMLIGARDK